MFVGTRCIALYLVQRFASLLEALLGCFVFSAFNSNLLFSRKTIVGLSVQYLTKQFAPVALHNGGIVCLVVLLRFNNIYIYIRFKETVVCWALGERPGTALRLGSCCRGH